jgi:hypothetical protein
LRIGGLAFGADPAAADHLFATGPFAAGLAARVARSPRCQRAIESLVSVLVSGA